MSRLAYFLIPVLICAQVDSSWAAIADLLSVPSDPLSDDDQYLTSHKQPQKEDCHQKRVVVGHKPQIVDVSLLRWGLPVACNVTRPFTPAPLYVFASLQI